MDKNDFDKEFTDAKDAYKRARKEQKDKIKEKFEDMKKSGDNSFGFVVKEVNDRSYPDNNWFGIDVTIEKNGKKKKYHIALQAYDKDQGSDNIHVLMDRLGIYEYDDNSDLSFDKIKDKMINANVDLPMNPYKYDLLFKEISNLEFNYKRNNYIEARRMQRQKIKEQISGEYKGYSIKYKKREQGNGSGTYNNSSTIMPFNNLIWKWITITVEDTKEETKGEPLEFVISLQAFDKYNKKGVYVDFDTIGIYLDKNVSGKTPDAIDKMIKTDISLPMDDVENLKDILIVLFLAEKVSSKKEKISDVDDFINKINNELIKKNIEVDRTKMREILKQYIKKYCNKEQQK